MNMRWQFLRVLSRTAGILLIAPVAWAQSAPPPPPPDDVTFAGGMPFGHDAGFGFVGFEGGMRGEVVKASPFSAQTSVETTQTLPDGNVINRKVAGAVYRDSQGRTRHEETLPAIGPFAASGNAPHAAFINDPVAGVHYVLEEDHKVARKFTPVNKSDVTRDHPHNRPANNAEETTESLGTQTINGVAATGTRITRTIPAGKIGNEKAIQIVTEKWVSSELQTTVMVKHSDPRNGTMVFQLQNISRAEPAATLFQVPSDYSVKEGGPRGEFRHGPGGPGGPGPVPAPGSQPE
jgi:hypothetical protein